MKARVAIFLLAAFAFACATEFVRTMITVITFVTTALVMTQ